MENDYTFPIVVKKERDEVVVKFIDFDVNELRYEINDDYITESKIMLANVLLEYERKRITIPSTRKLDSIEINEGEQLVFLNIWLPFYRTESEKYVKKTLTIPEWIDILAKEQNLNFSQILKEALLEELGLQNEVKKRKMQKFNRPMKKLEDFLVVSEKLIKSTKEEETDVLLAACNTKDFNLIVNIWLMWTNKIISLFLRETIADGIKSDCICDKEQWINLTEDFKTGFKNRINKECDKIVSKLKHNNVEESSVDLLGKYIKKFAEWILISSLKYDGIYERNECIYDYMRAITSEGMLKKNIKKEYWEEYASYYLFTLQHEIEAPYMYVLAWNLKNIYVHEKFNNLDEKIVKNSRNICFDCLKRVTSTTIEILLGNSIFSDYLESKVIARQERNDEIIPIITMKGSINFTNYLPQLSYNDQDLVEYVDVFGKKISKEVLISLPMTPMNIKSGDKITLSYLIKLLCSQLEK